MAREKSAATGIPVDFRQADMLDLPAELTGFDLTSAGARSAGYPDLTVFAELVADRLRLRRWIRPRRPSPGCGSPRASVVPTSLTVTADYFGRSTPRATTTTRNAPHRARDNPAALLHRVCLAAERHHRPALLLPRPPPLRSSASPQPTRTASCPAAPENPPADLPHQSHRAMFHMKHRRESPSTLRRQIRRFLPSGLIPRIPL